MFLLKHFKKSIQYSITFVLLSAVLLPAQQIDTLYVLQTTDVHGHIRAYDYFSDRPADYGLAKIYTRVIEYRRKHKNVVLLDGGDLIQGTPLVYYFNKIKTNVPNSLILALNYMGYDAMAVGNHDIEQGLFVYLRCRNQSQFPWLSANSLLPDGRTFFKPYTIIQKNGLRIGIIGLTTPGIPMWLDKTLYPGITWRDMIQTAQKWAPVLRPQVDVLIGLFHAGFEAEYSVAQTAALGLPNENASKLVAEQVPGFDIIFAGHSHRPYPKISKQNQRSPLELINDKQPLLINAGSWGRNLGIAQIVLKTSEEGKKWQVMQKSGWLESMRHVSSSSAIEQLTEYYHNKTLNYIRRPIAELTDTLNTADSRFADNPLVELVNKAQMAATGADISFAASFNDHLKIAPGKIRIKDVYGMYRYENFLYVVKMTGQQIKDYLNYSVRYYILKNGKVAANPKVAGYNYDMAEGIKYTVQVRPGGNTVSGIIMQKTGRPLASDKTYTVALNSYRATGGGGHMSAAHAQNAPVIWKSDEEIRNILTEYIKKLKVIHPQSDHNWKVVVVK